MTSRIVDNGIELESKDTRLDIKNRETGNLITSLDIPILVKINLDEFFVRIDDATVKIENPQIG